MAMDRVCAERLVYLVSLWKYGYEDELASMAQELRLLRVVAKEAQAIIDTRIWDIFSGLKSLDEALIKHQSEFPEVR